MRVLITGCSGFIGSNLIEHLKGDHEIYGADVDDPQVDRDGWQFYPGNLLDPEFCGDLVKTSGPEAIVHLAGLGGLRGSWDDPVLYVDANVVTTIRLLEALDRSGHPDCRFILASSSSVYGPFPTEKAFREDQPLGPFNPYAQSKHAAEGFLWAYGQRARLKQATALRLFTVYGPYNRKDMAIYQWADQLRKRKPITLIGEDTMRDWTPVADICRGIGLAIERKKGEPAVQINLGSGRPVPLAEMLGTLSVSISDGSPPEMETKARPYWEAQRTWADITRAKELLGWEPEVDQGHGVEAFAKWFLRT